MTFRHPELSSSLVRLMIGLAPVSVPANPKSPIRFLMPMADQIERMLSMTGNSEFGSKDGFLSDLESSLCGQVSPMLGKDVSMFYLLISFRTR